MPRKFLDLSVSLEEGIKSDPDFMLPIKTLISGPLTDKDGNMNGSFFMVEADSEKEIRVFQRNDPIFKANIWDEITISPFNKRVDNLSK